MFWAALALIPTQYHRIHGSLPLAGELDVPQKQKKQDFRFVTVEQIRQLGADSLIGSTIPFSCGTTLQFLAIS